MTIEEIKSNVKKSIEEKVETLMGHHEAPGDPGDPEGDDLVAEVGCLLKFQEMLEHQYPDPDKKKTPPF